MILVDAIVRCDECDAEVKVRVSLRMAHELVGAADRPGVRHDFSRPWQAFEYGEMPDGFEFNDGEFCAACAKKRQEEKDR